MFETNLVSLSVTSHGCVFNLADIHFVKKIYSAFTFREFLDCLTLNMKALQSIVLLVATHLALQHHISQDSNLQQHHLEKLKSVVFVCSCDL